MFINFLFSNFFDSDSKYSHFLRQFGTCSFRMTFYNIVTDEIYTIIRQLEAQENPIIVERMILLFGLPLFQKQKQLNLKHVQCSLHLFFADEFLQGFNFDQLKAG